MSKQTAVKKYRILGVDVDAFTITQAIEYIATYAKSNKPACYVTKPYSEFLDKTSERPELARLLNEGELCLPDAVSIQWASQYLYGGRPKWWRVITTGAAIVLRPSYVRHFFPEKFAGVNFTWQLLEACQHKGLSVYLIGSPRNGDIIDTAKTISKRLPGLKIIGTWPGIMKAKRGPELLADVLDNGVAPVLIADLQKNHPDIILVGMGFPLQEFVMAGLAKVLSHGVLIGEGGTFDYDSFGGERRRAPNVIQTFGLEWLWRLSLEPTRLGRQLAIPRFIMKVYRQGRQQKAKPPT